MMVLCYGVFKLEKLGRDPFAETLLVQVDQAFNRQIFCRANPTVVPCLLPKGKYIVTGRWTVLSGQEKMALQGISPSEMETYSFTELSDWKQSDLAGNAWAAQPQGSWLAEEIVSKVIGGKRLLRECERERERE
ncbi:unnamed protein product [Symbiodinium sp. CCMP2592]|nr:unnamed protein product [Symbiodinium sp. CCMP2592]CAE7255173.1 unnamed protein product [Symbiodinium sp. CCMP2592]